MANCIYCGKYVTHDYVSMDGKICRNIMVKQSGKYGQTIVAHKACYLYNININVRKNNNVKS